MKKCAIYPDAIAHITGKADSHCITGTVKFYQKRDHVLVVATVCGLPRNASGFYGFHIHEGKSCAGVGFANTGSHYNPAGTPHPNHTGDLPPLLYSNGGAHLAVATDRFTVREILGRTVVVHSDPDDFRSQPAGNAGTKIACGMIEKK